MCACPRGGAHLDRQRAALVGRHGAADRREHREHARHEVCRAADDLHGADVVAAVDGAHVELLGVGVRPHIEHRAHHLRRARRRLQPARARGAQQPRRAAVGCAVGDGSGEPLVGALMSLDGP
eukprot:319440-Prymnesium_polylepis.1